MEFKRFLETVSGNEPPVGINDHLKALWYDKKGDWESAHSIVQILNDQNAEWIHAYLHRKEGDPYNASYWYRKANKSKPDKSILTYFQFLGILK